MRIPAPVPAEAAAEIRRLACAAFDAISCEGLARVDFFYTPAGKILVNEINTMPGMTPASGFPMMWAASRPAAAAARRPDHPDRAAQAPRPPAVMFVAWRHDRGQSGVVASPAGLATSMNRPEAGYFLGFCRR